MSTVLSRRELLGALGAAAVLAPAVAAGQTYPPDKVPFTSTGIWPWLHAQLVLEPGVSWLDTAGSGPAARAVLVQQYRQLERQSLDFHAFAEADAPNLLRQALITSGQFLGADPGDLVITSGTRAGLALVAAGLDLQPGDEVLTTTHDHPAAVYAWLAQARRQRLRVVQLPQAGVPGTPQELVARFAGAINPRTKVLLVSHVQYTDGTVMPIREICTLARSHGIFTIVDGAQAAGQLEPLRVPELGCDAYATCLHKWLNGPAGTGLLYLRRDAHARVWPAQPDEHSGVDVMDRFGAPLVANTDLTLVAQLRYGGTLLHQAPSIAAVPLAYELQYAAERTRIALRMRELAMYLRDALSRIRGVEILTPKHPSLTLGIVSFRVTTRDSGKLVAALAAEDRIVLGHVRHAATFDAIRASLHPGTSHEELDRCVGAVQRRL